MGASLGLDLRPQDASVAGDRRARIGLLPHGARAARARLFAALEHAYPVRFQEPAARDGDLDWDGLDGILLIGGEPPTELPAGLPCLRALGEERPSEGAPQSIALGHHPSLARPLRGGALTERWVDPLPERAPAGGPHELPLGYATLASAGGAPAWVLTSPAGTTAATAPPSGRVEDSSPHELVAAAPAELAPGEALRERLAPGRCLALLALVHFVRRVAHDPDLDAPLDAAFVLDDPNLHWPRYGHLRYAELARHAQAHGYHMVIAMPPIDGWLAHPRVVRLLREHPSQLSLCVHGNDHLGPELGRILSPASGLALAEQALARAAAFERRTGIPFERVMVPPHEQLTEAAAQGLRAAGFASVCVSRPYPWIAPTRPGAAAALSAGPPQRGALAGWEPRELVAGGLPVLLRTGFNAPREDLLLRAFLGQPLILYGHHDRLAHGLDVLADATAAIDALGNVRWGSLATITHGIAHGSEIAGEPDGHRTARDEHRTQQRAATELDGPARPPQTTRPRLRPLLRRLASEARDRTRI
jgi:hypothetical protein